MGTAGIHSSECILLSGVGVVRLPRRNRYPNANCFKVLFKCFFFVRAQLCCIRCYRVCLPRRNRYSNTNSIENLFWIFALFRMSALVFHEVCRKVITVESQRWIWIAVCKLRAIKFASGIFWIPSGIFWTFSEFSPFSGWVYSYSMKSAGRSSLSTRWIWIVF